MKRKTRLDHEQGRTTSENRLMKGECNICAKQQQQSSRKTQRFENETHNLEFLFLL